MTRLPTGCRVVASPGPSMRSGGSGRALRALPDLCVGIVSERLVSTRRFSFGHLAPARPGLSFTLCIGGYRTGGKPLR
jgi:hypothetical protein